MNIKTRNEHEELIAAAGRDFACVFRRGGGSSYLVTCLQLPPMTAYGETLEEARVNAAEEIEAWLEVVDSYRAAWPR